MERATDPETGAYPPGWALGLGGFTRTLPFRTADDVLLPVPVVYYRGDRCLIYVKKGSCRLFGGESFEVSTLADLRFDGYEEEDGGPFLEGMNTRDLAADLGLALEVDTPMGDLELEAVADPFGVHEGHEIRLGWSAPIVLEGWVIRFAVANHWKSSDLTRY